MGGDDAAGGGRFQISDPCSRYLRGLASSRWASRGRCAARDTIPDLLGTPPLHLRNRGETPVHAVPRRQIEAVTNNPSWCRSSSSPLLCARERSRVRCRRRSRAARRGGRAVSRPRSSERIFHPRMRDTEPPSPSRRQLARARAALAAAGREPMPAALLRAVSPDTNRRRGLVCSAELPSVQPYAL